MFEVGASRLWAPINTTKLCRIAMVDHSLGGAREGRIDGPDVVIKIEAYNDKFKR